MPKRHWLLFLHLWLQLPQCLSSHDGFTHHPLQQTSEYLHFLPHLPQLFRSFITLTHFFLQQSGTLESQTLGYLSQLLLVMRASWWRRNLPSALFWGTWSWSKSSSWWNVKWSSGAGMDKFTDMMSNKIKMVESFEEYNILHAKGCD